MKRLTYTGRNRYPTWSPDSTRVAFQSDRDGDAAIFVQRLSDTRARRLTIPRPGESHEPEAWSPDGKVLLFGVTRGADVSLWMRTSDGNTSPFRGVHSTTKIGAVFHPNGHWVAYASSDDKKKTVYVEPFPGPGRKEQLVHTGGGHPNHPLWAPDGHGLFYNPGPGQFESVDVTTEPSFIFGKAVAVPRPFAGAGLDSRRPYDITGAGKFVSPVAAGQSRRAAAQIEVVLNWFEDLKARFPAAKASGRDGD
jgi:Tol biopolymer transport system component